MSSRFDNGLISPSKAPRKRKKSTPCMDRSLKEKTEPEVKLGLFSEKGDNWVEITIPAITVSEANGGAKISFKSNGKTYYKAEHWSLKHHRHKKQKGQVHLMLNPLRHLLGRPCEILITRYAPDKLDRFDNLPVSMKWILDATCEIITNDYRPGRGDDDPRILDVRYNQITSKEYGVKVRITHPTHSD